MKTLDELLIALFPNGTSFPEIAGFERADGKVVVDYSHAPAWPPDVFAYVAHLLDLSGAYHHVSPETRGRSSSSGVRQIKVSDADRAAAVDVGAKWAKSLRRKAPRVHIPVPPRQVRDLWNSLRIARDNQVFLELDSRAAPPKWWRDALMLMMIADEAARKVGFDPDKRGGEADPGSAFELFMDVFRFVSPTEIGRQGADNFYSCSFANQNLVGVMPKSRTPVVGCTLRSLSHNLALMPAGGRVRVRWLSPHEVEGDLDERPLKILMIPYPYCIDAECFEPVDVANVDPAVTPWGWFHISPRWLGSKRHGEPIRRAGEFADFVVELVNEGSREGEPVGAIVLPEAALNETFFSTLFDAVLRRCPKVEMLVSGTSEMPLAPGRVRSGNFVAQGVFVTSRGKRQGIRTIREKHHRWRLERSQIETYQLTSRLNPSTLWWEDIDITSRSLDVVAFRTSATMTTLICEDLARVDPCQGAVRAIGPTLLVALLMDGSQLSTRWPCRYASVLSEDPGCSVLTVSSLGLINRTRLRDGSKPKWSVALWRDDQSGPTEVVLSPGHQAVCLTVDPQWRTECSLDGRQDECRALAWIIRKSGADAPRSIRTSAGAPPWIINGTA